MEGLIIFALFCAGIGALIGRSRGRIGSGLVWGGIFGPIGWIVTAFLPDLRKKCPDCASPVIEGAKKCRCGTALVATGTP